MQIEIFTICDAAADYSGRLNIMGSFEGIAADAAPITRDRCAVVARLRMDREDEGERRLQVRFLDSENNVVGPKMDANLKVSLPAGRVSMAHNLVLNINGMVFPAFGIYRVQLSLDGEVLRSLPLTVAKAARSKGRPAMDN